MGIACGYHGFIAIDFGTNSGADSEKMWCEFPHTEFRQSFFLYSLKPFVIQRKLFTQVFLSTF